MKQEQIMLTHQILKSRKGSVAKSYLLERLECSESTLKRIFSELRNEYNAPLQYQVEQRGYCYTEERFELNLPGLWSSPETLLALVSIQKLLAQMQLDVLDEHLQGLKQEIQQYLKRKKIKADQIDRIRILPITARISNTSLTPLQLSCIRLSRHYTLGARHSAWLCRYAR